jgi:hypothetical protein
MEEEYVRYR